MPAVNKTLYAGWEQVAYTIHFETNGATEILPYHLFYGDPILYPEDPEKIDYHFGGWFEDSDLTTPANMDTMPPNDVTLYAAWHREIIFVTNGGESVEPIRAQEGALIDPPEEPMKTHYDFTGWFEDEDLTIPFVFEYMPPFNMRLYARYEPVQFESSGSTIDGSMEIDYGVNLDEYLPYRDHHIFGGWYADSQYENEVHAVTKDQTIYAEWIPFDMVSVGYLGLDYDFPVGINDDDVATVPGGYSIATTLTTYQAWYKVRTWAEANDYHFQNPGQEGSHGFIDEPPTGSQQPVTNISFGDIIVWLNALSEMHGLTPVYQTETHEIITDARIENSAVINQALQMDANGYRLPLSDEWEMAARFLYDPEPLMAPLATFSGYWTPGNYPSGGTDTYLNATILQSVAWYDGNSASQTQNVALLEPNQLGVYDMNGNLSEWCFDRIDDTKHYIRGGSYIHGHDVMQIGHRDAYEPQVSSSEAGFRIYRTPSIPEDAVLETIEMERLPLKTAYDIDDPFDPSGGIVKLNFSDGSKLYHELTPEMIDSPNLSTLGEHEVTVTYTIDDVTKETVLIVIVEESEPFEPGALGAIPDPRAEQVEGLFPGLLVYKVAREKSPFSGYIQPLVEMQFPSPSSLGADFYTLEYYETTTSLWKTYRYYDDPLTTTNDHFSLNLYDLPLKVRLKATGGPIDGYVSNEVTLTYSSVDTDFTGWGLNTSMDITGVMYPYVGHGAQVDGVNVRHLDGEEFELNLSYQWYRIHPNTYELIPIQGATNPIYVTTFADVGYTIMVKIYGDEVEVGGYMQLLATDVMLPVDAFATNVDDDGFTLNFNYEVNPEDLEFLTIYDNESWLALDILSITQGSNGGIYHIEVDLSGVNGIQIDCYVEQLWMIATTNEEFGFIEMGLSLMMNSE